jgi:hypothetical protein
VKPILKKQEIFCRTPKMTLMSHRISAGRATDLVLSVSIKGIKYLIKSFVTIYSIISINNVKTNTVISWKRQKGGFYDPE